MRVAWNVSLAVRQRVWFQHHEDSAPDGENAQQLNTTYLTVNRICPLFDNLIICISDIDMYLKKLMTYNAFDLFKTRNHIYGELVSNFISLCTCINTYI
jgi:hypothetical protein